MRKIALLVVPALLVVAAPAGAAVPASLATHCTTKTAAPGYSYKFCDDGLAPTSGMTPNVGGVNAITVPAKYDGYAGLPARAVDATTVPGSDANGDIALDVDISYPTGAAPKGGFPLIAIMHGCCSGSKKDWESETLDPTAGGGLTSAAERWHYNNAWFASRGYVVVTYTARGFHSGASGSTGQTQLDSRLYEMNDFQSLVAQLVDDNPLSETDSNFKVNPSKIVATGGSYGGGFAWLALTDPKWKSADGIDISLAAAAPRYGWTDLLYSLIPNGTHSSELGSLPAFDGSSDTTPVGSGKKSTLGILYALGLTGATFPTAVGEDKACVDNGDPIETSPICANTLARIGEYINDRSAYQQNAFFTKLASDPSYRIPAFVYAPWTDPLFTPIENIRMYNRLRQTVPNYPIQMVLGDSTPHFAQNKTKEWADLCGNDHHVCTLGDYPRSDVDRRPATVKRYGITTRLNRFIDFYTRPAHDRRTVRPRFDVTAATEVCPETATSKYPADEAGKQITASSYQRLANGRLSINYTGNQTTTNQVTPNTHATQAEPLSRLGRCVKSITAADPGIAVYTSKPLRSTTTMLGLPKIAIDYSASDATNLQLNTRIYDVLPNGDELMVDRGPRRVTAASGTVQYELYGNGWVFAPGHKIRVEIAQDDDPFVTASNIPSSTTISSVRLTLPIRERRMPITGSAGP